MADEKLDYEALEKMYQSATTGNARPSYSVSTLQGAIAVWGKEEVDKMLADGRMRFMTEEEMDG